MKISLVPEEIILEYLDNCLKGKPEKSLKKQIYFKHLPETIEVTQEFVDQWSQIVCNLVKKFIVDTFNMHSFLYEEDGMVKRCSPMDQAFWSQADFRFSFRGIDRIWENILFSTNKVSPIYALALPADALLICILQNNFKFYNFKWLKANKANWIIKAIFIALSQDYSPLPGWISLFEQPEKVELPIRDFLICRSADYMTYLNQLISKLIDYKKVEDSELLALKEQLSRPGVVIDLSSNLQDVYTAFEVGRKFIDSFQKAFRGWTNELTLALDDERYLRSLYNSSGLEGEIREFERQVEEYNEQVELEEVVNESLIFN